MNLSKVIKQLHLIKDVRYITATFEKSLVNHDDCHPKVKCVWGG